MNIQFFNRFLLFLHQFTCMATVFISHYLTFDYPSKSLEWKNGHSLVYLSELMCKLQIEETNRNHIPLFPSPRNGGDRAQCRFSATEGMGKIWLINRRIWGWFSLHGEWQDLVIPKDPDVRVLLYLWGE